jgi:hypothetical protein
MRTSETTAKLFAALAKAQDVIKDPPMTGRGQAGRSVTKYAMLGDIVPVIRAAFAPNGLAFVQSVAASDSGPVIATLISHSSGEWMQTGYPLALASDPQRQGDPPPCRRDGLLRRRRPRRSRAQRPRQAA